MSKQEAAYDDLIIKVRVPRGYPLCSHLNSVGMRDRASQLLMYASVGFHFAHQVAGDAPAPRKAAPAKTQELPTPVGSDPAPDAAPSPSSLDMGFISTFLDHSRLGVVSNS